MVHAAAHPQAAAVSTPALAVEVDSVTKSYAGRVVVDRLSFAIRRGETFGLVGPNGSGKTTTIRMLLDIVRPDCGQIRILGRPFSDALKDRIGYLPEERGLYRSVSVERTLFYLAALKGVTRERAAPRIEELLRRAGLWQHRQKNVGALSRGMSQLIGFCVAILHRPDLLILDEPFSGLDPLNVRLMKEMIAAAGREGTSIIFSTHQMEDIEELCERVLMLAQGRRVLYGALQEIKDAHRAAGILLEYEGPLAWVDGIRDVVRRGPNVVELILAPGYDQQMILRQLVSSDVTVHRFERAVPSLNEIFITVAQQRRQDDAKTADDRGL